MDYMLEVCEYELWNSMAVSWDVIPPFKYVIPTTSTDISAVWPNILTLEIPSFSSSAPISHCHPMNLKILCGHSEFSNKSFLGWQLPQCLGATVVPLFWQIWSNLPIGNSARIESWFLGQSIDHCAHRAIIKSQKSANAKTQGYTLMNQVAVNLLLVCNLLPRLGAEQISRG